MPDAYTPEAIASIIEQMKKQERVTISSIEDREYAVVIYGSIAIADSIPMSGVISYLPKSKQQEVSGMSNPIPCKVGRIVSWDCPCGQHFKEQENETKELTYTRKYLCSCGRWLLLEWDVDLFGTRVEDITSKVAV